MILSLNYRDLTVVLHIRHGVVSLQALKTHCIFLGTQKAKASPKQEWVKGKVQAKN